MTILVAASTSEGLVLAADSLTTWRSGAKGNARLEIATRRARKVFPLTSTVGAATQGGSQIYGYTIASLADRFRWGRPSGARHEVSAVVDEFITFLRRFWEAERVKAPKVPAPDQVGFLLAGYDRRGIGRIYEIRIPKWEPQLLSSTDAPNYHWRGQGEAISRLMKGIDPSVDQARLGPQTAAGLEYAVMLRHMSLQDAVEFVRFLGRVAIGIDRFTSGTLGGRHRDRLVGGRLRIATVTVDGFQWVPLSSSC